MALITHKDESKSIKTDNRLASISYSIVNSVDHEQLTSVKYESRLCHTIKQVVSSHHYLFRMTEAILDKQKFIKLLETAIKTEADKALEQKMKKEDKCRKLSEAAYSTGARCISSSDRPRPLSQKNAPALEPTVRTMNRMSSPQHGTYLTNEVDAE